MRAAYDGRMSIRRTDPGARRPGGTIEGNDT